MNGLKKYLLIPQFALQALEPSEARSGFAE